MKLKGVRRRIVYVAFYELIAIMVTSLALALVSKRPVAEAALVSVIASTLAVVWNYVFNTWFERWEARQAVKGRSLKRRIAHALGFEGGLAIMLVPLFAWLLQLSLWHALITDLGLLLFFLVYTFVFTWCFDRIFGLPQSSARHA